MPANIRIVSTNEADSATLTSADFTAGLPVTNLQIEGRGTPARTTNAVGTKAIKGSWTEGHIIGAAVLYGVNLTGAATWRFRAWDNVNQTGTVVYDSGTITALDGFGWGEFGWGLVPWGSTVFDGWQSAWAVLWFDPVGAYSWQIDVTDAANPAGYLEMDRVLVGYYFEPEINAEFGLTLSWPDTTVQERAESKSLRSTAGANFRELKFMLGTLSAVENATLLDIARKVGFRNEIFVSVFPEDGSTQTRDYAMLGKFTGTMPVSTLESWERITQSLNIQEV